MENFINPAFEAYANNYTSTNNALQQEVLTYTAANHPKAHMISGHLQGQLLSFISTLKQPKYVLEIGTFTGFSALCLANGLQESGELHTIEQREQDAATAQNFFNKSPLAKKIFLHIGNAIDIIPNLPYKWDLVFIDADKTGYLGYYKMMLPLLAHQGMILVDNVFFHGQVLAEQPNNKNAKAVKEFNEYVLADNTTEQVFLPIRDGLMLIKKR